MRRHPILALALLASGCGATTHPRYAPELVRSWPECVRIVVLQGTVATDVKNYKAEDWFREDSLGKRYGQLLAQAAARVLRDDGGREPRVAAEAAAALGGDEDLTRTLADRMLLSARETMARDPGYAEHKIVGLAADPGVVPDELRRSFDAVLVVGGRTKYESPEERTARYEDIVVRNAVAYPLLFAAVFVPPILPISLATMAQGLTGYWVGAPNVSYFSVALFDAQTGRLLYSNDWFDTEKVDEPEDFHKAAREMLRPLCEIEGDELAPLGEPPEQFEE